MITEEMIQKHRYFTTGKGDMWIVRSIKTRAVSIDIQRIDVGAPYRGADEPLKLDLDSAEGQRFFPITLPTAAKGTQVTSDATPAAKEAAAPDPRGDKIKAMRQEGKSPGRKSSTGHKGVYPKETKMGTKYIAKVRINGGLKYLGTHDTPEQAAAAIADYQKERCLRALCEPADNTVRAETPAERSHRRGYKDSSNDKAIV